MQVNRMPESHCPKCGAMLDCASCLDDDKAKPVEGDISVCIDCATVLTFDAKLMLQELTKEAIDDLPFVTQMDLGDVIRTVKQINKK